MEYQLNAENFEKEVLQSELPVLVDFYADWCGPCKMIAPAVKELAEQYDGKIKVCKLNVTGNEQIAARYSVMNIPNFVFIKNGEVVDRLIGADKKELERKCQLLTE